MHASYFNTILLAFAALTSAYPASPYKFNSPKSSEKVDDSLAFLQGLTNNKHDMSGRRGDPVDKYFHESTHENFHAHYDGRFAYTILPHATRRTQLRALVRAYLSTMNSLHAETWIMHGSLLGWWWNRQIMPWDDDLDVQVSESAISFLAAYHNMTVHSFDVSDLDLTPDEVTIVGSKEKRYLLEINPHYSNPSTSDTLNVIDARWIDIDTGLFIDITTLRIDRKAYPPTETFDDVDEHENASASTVLKTTTSSSKTSTSSSSPRESQDQTAKFLPRDPHPGPTRMYCKDRHHYLSSQIYPLRTSVFEGIPVKVPYAYQELLIEEYGAKSLTNTNFWREGYEFVQEKKEWVTMSRYKTQHRMEVEANAELEAARLEAEMGEGAEFVQWSEKQETARKMRKAGREGVLGEHEVEVKGVVLPEPVTRGRVTA